MGGRGFCLRWPRSSLGLCQRFIGAISNRSYRCANEWRAATTGTSPKVDPTRCMGGMFWRHIFASSKHTDESWNATTHDSSDSWNRRSASRRPRQVTGLFWPSRPRTTAGDRPTQFADKLLMGLAERPYPGVAYGIPTASAD